MTPFPSGTNDGSAAALAHWGLLLALVAGGWASISATQQARAQDADTSCVQTLTDAEETYRNRNYAEAVAQASRCTNTEVVADTTAIQAHRIITLASLRQGNLVQARSAVQSILQIDPEYTANPVDDPPSYDLFVSMVRQELAFGGDTDTTTADAPEPQRESPSAPPAADRGNVVLKIAGIGFSDYTGDLPDQSQGHPFDLQEFKTGSGFPYVFSFEVGYEAPSNLGIILGFQAGNYPIVGYSTGTGSISDSWRYTPQLLIRYTLGEPGRSTALYLDVGGNVTFGGKGLASPGYGPSVGGGVDIPLNKTLSFFVESRFNLTLPDDAIDGTSYPEDYPADADRSPVGSITGPFDSVNQLLGIGLRLRFGGGSGTSPTQ